LCCDTGSAGEDPSISFRRQAAGSIVSALENLGEQIDNLGGWQTCGGMVGARRSVVDGDDEDRDLLLTQACSNTLSDASNNFCCSLFLFSISAIQLL
jgi:hypothetical protein